MKRIYDIVFNQLHKKVYKNIYKIAVSCIFYGKCSFGNPIGGNLHASDSDHHPVLKIVHPVVECGVGHH